VHLALGWVKPTHEIKAKRRICERSRDEQSLVEHEASVICSLRTTMRRGYISCLRIPPSLYLSNRRRLNRELEHIFSGALTRELQKSPHEKGKDSRARMQYEHIL
jgi:hypothetical protein